MCERCHSSADPFESKPIVMDGVDANELREDDTGHEWEKDPQSREEFSRYAENYMEHVFDKYGFPVLTRDMVEYRGSGRMTSCLGRCSEIKPYSVELILSWDAYNRRDYDWERLRNTVRHELVHASNFVEYGYMGHGPTFIQEAERLDVDNIGRYDEPDPRYYIVCNGCGVVLWRQKKSKKVKKPNAHCRCANCKGEDWDVLTDPPANNHPQWQRG